MSKIHPPYFSKEMGYHKWTTLQNSPPIVEALIFEAQIFEAPIFGGNSMYLVLPIGAGTINGDLQIS